jgi:hypothetical protein
MTTAREKLKEFVRQLGADRRDTWAAIHNREKPAASFDVFSNLYPDEAHFLFELLQNAEDARACEVSVQLSRKGCIFSHNGTPFNEEDIESITSIGVSSKKNDETKIGVYGLGFKSVYSYTDTPTIRSGEVSFFLEEKMIPVLMENGPKLDTETIIEIPFGSGSVGQKKHYSEISERLKSLDELVLLYLQNVSVLEWKISSNSTHKFEKKLHSSNHVEIIRSVSGKEISSRHFLVFSEQANNTNGHEVAVAYELELQESVKKFSPKRPLVKQLQLVLAEKGTVSIYFPAIKEHSGLKFHIHAPFEPDVSRSAIKNNRINGELLSQLAVLFGSTFSELIKLGVLNNRILAIVPNRSDELLPEYSGFYQIAKMMFKDESLVSAKDGQLHISGKNVLANSGKSREFLTDDDLSYLFGNTLYWHDTLLYEITRSRRFLKEVGARSFSLKSLLVSLIDAEDESQGLQDILRSIHNWMGKKPLTWHQDFYLHLHESSLPEELEFLANLPILLTRNGSYQCGKNCYFPLENTGKQDFETGLFLKKGSLENRDSEKQKSISLFLEQLGVSIFGEAEQIQALLENRYCSPKSAGRISKKQYKNDLERIIKFANNNPNHEVDFSKSFIFETSDGWKTPTETYLDEPITKTGLSAYYSMSAEVVLAETPVRFWLHSFTRSYRKEYSTYTDQFAFYGYQGER